PWIIASVTAVICLLALAFIHLRETPPAERVLRYSLAPPEKSRIHTFALSPDGRYLAIAAAVEGKRQLWVRPLEPLGARPLRGTEDAAFPFWSPDSHSIGFFAGRTLRRVAVEGGPVQILCDALNGRGGTWNRDGIIVFAMLGHGLQRVAAVGG